MATGDANVTIDNGFLYRINPTSGVYQKDTSGGAFSPKLLGFHLVGQSMINDKPKQRETISYIERDGEETAPALIDNNKFPREPFDYELEFIYFSKGAFDFESKLEFLKNTLTSGSTDTFRDSLQIRNEYTNTKILGYYKGISVSTYDRKKYIGTKDYQEFKVVFRVPKPNMCNFNGTN